MLLGASQSAAFGARLQLRAPAARPAPAGALVTEAAHKKGGGSSKNKDDSHAQRLGVKVYGDQPCIAGNIIIRQRGTVWTPGPGTMMGKDHTIFAVEDGMVKFDRSSVRARICVVPKADVPEGAPVKETARTRKFAKFPPRNSAAKEEGAAVAR